jgi:hypothetical protein
LAIKQNYKKSLELNPNNTKVEATRKGTEQVTTDYRRVAADLPLDRAAVVAKFPVRARPALSMRHTNLPLDFCVVPSSMKVASILSPLIEPCT